MLRVLETLAQVTREPCHKQCCFSLEVIDFSSCRFSSYRGDMGKKENLSKSLSKSLKNPSLQKACANERKAKNQQPRVVSDFDQQLMNLKARQLGKNNEHIKNAPKVPRFQLYPSVFVAANLIPTPQAPVPPTAAIIDDLIPSSEPVVQPPSQKTNTYVKSASTNKFEVLDTDVVPVSNITLQPSLLNFRPTSSL